MNVTLAENLFLSNLNFIELDSLSIAFGMIITHLIHAKQSQTLPKKLILYAETADMIGLRKFEAKPEVPANVNVVNCNL